MVVTPPGVVGVGSALLRSRDSLILWRVRLLAWVERFGNWVRAGLVPLPYRRARSYCLMESRRMSRVPGSLPFL
jgi:hypothetical protein